jgi:hypothetical protein
LSYWNISDFVCNGSKLRRGSNLFCK